MVENSPKSSVINNASKEELVHLLTELGDPLVLVQISFPFILGPEDLARKPANILEITRLKCHIARALEEGDVIYTRKYKKENPEYFKNLTQTENFLKGHGL